MVTYWWRERFDPENPEHLVYAQALNMENYLYLVVLGFGVTTLALGMGFFMLIVGVALGGVGAYMLTVQKDLRRHKT